VQTTALTAPEECFPRMKKFSRKHVTNITAGYSIAVCNTHYVINCKFNKQ